MAGELNIKDEQFANELLAQSLPMAFIDFEAFVPTIPGIVPGVTPTTTIPCQWSCHTIYEHGLDAAVDMTHGEFLWVGDRGWNPIYAFVQSLYDETESANTIAIYTNYEITCLNNCKKIAEDEISRWHRNEVKLGGFYAYTEDGARLPLYEFYPELIDWLDEPYDFEVEDEDGNVMDLSDIRYNVCDWYDEGKVVDYNLLVMDGYGNKVPLMDIAPEIGPMCDSMLSRFYDLCYGPIGGRNGGVKTWLQSPEFHNSNSIKHVLPAAIAEYSGAEDLLLSQGLPANGYEGLRQMGQIAKGDECTTIYLATLDRPPREGVSMDEPGHAEFDANIEEQCLVYCCLDTLSMVMIYLAVLESTERWADDAYDSVAEFARFDDDDLFHFIEFDADNRVFYKGCDEEWDYPYPYDTEIEIISEAELMNMPIREQYGAICPKCRRLRNIS